RAPSRHVGGVRRVSGQACRRVAQPSPGGRSTGKHPKLATEYRHGRSGSGRPFSAMPKGVAVSDLPRTVLPIPERQHVGLTTYDAKDPDTAFPAVEPLRPPQDAPNVLVIMLDDAGFGSSSAFGGPCSTPTFERLAEQGLKFNRFHTTALCSPSRQ